jgi:glutamate carboxypeptidase
VEGGGAVNVVPDRAECRFNVRVATADEQRMVQQRLSELSQEFNARNGYGLTIAGGFTAPPKPLDERMRDLQRMVDQCGRDLGMQITWRATGGTCDGNRLAAAGLPNVDSLGPRGGNLHSPQEFLLVDSLAERAKLSALLLMKLAAGELPWPDWARRGRK